VLAVAALLGVVAVTAARPWARRRDRRRYDAVYERSRRGRS
jgi:hypothetical protein